MDMIPFINAHVLGDDVRRSCTCGLSSCSTSGRFISEWWQTFRSSTASVVPFKDTVILWERTAVFNVAKIRGYAAVLAGYIKGRISSNDTLFSWGLPEDSVPWAPSTPHHNSVWISRPRRTTTANRRGPRSSMTGELQPEVSAEEQQNTLWSSDCVIQTCVRPRIKSTISKR